MAVDQGRAHRHDGVVPVNEQLREIFGDATQMEISANLKAHGLEEGSQTTVSAWLRGARKPTLDQLAQIEDIYGLERGTVLARAGYISDAAKAQAPTQSPADFMTESRARFDQASDVLSEVSAVALQTAALVRANREQLVLIAEHLGVPVVPEPSVVE